MFEFHGWFCLRASPFYDDDDESMESIQHAEARIAALGWDRRFTNTFAELRMQNGESYIYLGGFPNHRGVIGTELEDLLIWVAQTLPGSYGLLYWRDDEGSPPAGPNNFQVRVMARGTLTTRFDPFLSPMVPVLEDTETSAEDLSRR